MTVLLVHYLGMRPYEPVFAAMKAHIEAAEAQTSDQVWLVQHPPVFTQGQAGRPEHVLMPGDIPVVPVDRGGQVTYHGPGQWVIYPLLELRRMKLDIRKLVSALEQTAIDALADYGIAAARRCGAPGVYVDDAKIASIGLRVRRGRSYHGIAFNMDMDLSPFQRINPCGYAGLRMTQLKDLLPAAAMPAPAAVAERLLAKLAVNLGYTGWRQAENLPVALAMEPADE
ncbi:MAG: lipoyl(octanoyl) transferase LipB [Porticoccaceae bacterium]